MIDGPEGRRGRWIGAGAAVLDSGPTGGDEAGGRCRVPGEGGTSRGGITVEDEEEPSPAGDLDQDGGGALGCEEEESGWAECTVDEGSSWREDDQGEGSSSSSGGKVMEEEEGPANTDPMYEEGEGPPKRDDQAPGLAEDAAGEGLVLITCAESFEAVSALGVVEEDPCWADDIEEEEARWRGRGWEADPADQERRRRVSSGGVSSKASSRWVGDGVDATGCLRGGVGVGTGATRVCGVVGAEEDIEGITSEGGVGGVGGRSRPDGEDHDRRAGESRVNGGRRREGRLAWRGGVGGQSRSRRRNGGDPWGVVEGGTEGWSSLPLPLLLLLPPLPLPLSLSLMSPRRG
jgi:hypothetical protein